MKTFLAAALLCLLALASVPAAQAQAPLSRDETCATVYDFPDLGWRVCVAPADPACKVYEDRTTIAGTERNCLAPALASESGSLGPPDLSQWPKCVPAAVGFVCFSPYWPGCNVWIVWTAIPAQPTCLYRSDPPTAAAGVETPPCYEVYSETHLVGPYWLVRRDSCSAQVYQCPDGYDPPAPPCREVPLLEASAASSEPNCLQMYRETDLGLVRIVSRDSCHTDHYVCEQEKADILAVRSLDASQCDTGLTTTSAQPLPPLPDPLGRTCYTQGQGELQSRTCIDPNSTDCTIYRQQVTGQGSSWVCYPSGESGSDW